MANVCTVQDFARRYVDYQNIQAPAERDCAFYNFEVTGFNLSTALTITSFALTILNGSILLAALCALAYSIRGSFYRAIMHTGTENLEEKAQIIHERMILGIDPTEQIIGSLNIEDEDWKMVKVQLLDFVVWMNSTPAVRQ